jgi:xylulokinase
MARVTVGIDIGTTSVKAVAADDDGEIVARTQIRHALRAPNADVFEHDAGLVWRDGVRLAWGEVSEGHDVSGATVAAMVPSLCPVDVSGDPIGPGLLYGDARGRPDGVADDEDQEFTGFAAWHVAQTPDAAAYWPAQAVANAALCGVGAIDSSTASTAMPLANGLEWDADECASIGTTPDRFPLISPGLDPIGEADGAVLSGGTIDALAEQMVADATEAGDVVVICGTTLITWVLTPEWVEIDGLWTVPYTVRGLMGIGGASNAGGLFLDRIRSLVGDEAAHDEAQAGLDPGRVPVWAPYLRGERTPLHDPAKRAALVDLELGDGPPGVLRAAYEAAGFVARHHIDLSGVEAKRIVAVGGGTRSALWMQALADATGLVVDVSTVPEGAAYGAAFMSRVTAGLESNTSDSTRWASTGHSVEPDERWRSACNERYERFLVETAFDQTVEPT